MPSTNFVDNSTVIVAAWLNDVDNATYTDLPQAQADIAAHTADLANPHVVTKTQVGLGNVDNTSDVNKPVSTLQAAADTAATNAAKAYADGLVIGLLDDRGNYDASTNLFPSTGGSGTAGAIMKGDVWTITVAGVLGGTAADVGQIVRALADTPGQTAGNWAISASGGGAVGGGTDKVFYENDTTVTTAYTITTGKNAMCAGPITFNAAVTVPSGSRLTVV